MADNQDDQRPGDPDQRPPDPESILVGVVLRPCPLCGELRVTPAPASQTESTDRSTRPGDPGE
jgi:hypothetical protein